MPFTSFILGPETMNEGLGLLKEFLCLYGGGFRVFKRVSGFMA